MPALVLIYCWTLNVAVLSNLNLEVGADWWVPEHYFMEVVSILRRYVRTGDLTQFEADHLVARFRIADVSKAELQPMVTEV
jgi:hypothetical protein